MRRFVTLAVLLLFTIPFGVSISGCSKAVTVTYCNELDSGVHVGQTVTLDLEPRLTGISINQGAIGSVGAPTGKDCKGSASSVAGTVYASSNRTIVDVNPVSGTGGLCAGSWNRNSGGGVADYTVCTPNGKEGTAYITASAQGVTSNPIAVYVHPVVTSIVLGTPSVDCTTDFASNCYAVNTQSCYLPATSTSPLAPPAGGNPYTGVGCISQEVAAQLAARVYAGTGAGQQNISCLVGPLQFTAQIPSVVTIDTNGLATAAQPGSTIINAQISQSSSTAGSFSTCPPKTITLTAAGSTTAPTAPITVAQNVLQELTTTIIDTKGNPITNIGLTYVSTTPVTIPTSLNNITPLFPGAAAITAICQPPTCNPSAFDQIGLNGNGTPVFSNPVQINATGTNNSTVLYIASTESQYILPVDFTVATQGSPTRLPYVPNSLVLSEDGTEIYMGSANELMVYNTTSNALTNQNVNVSGKAIALSPNNATLVFTDPVRKLTYLYSTASSSVTTQYGGVAVQAQWTPDSSTVYIATDDNHLLVYSTFTGWRSVDLTVPATDVAITVPNAGAYLAEQSAVEVRSGCPVTTVQNPNTINATTTNVFYPSAGVVGATGDRIAATNDGMHMLTATTTSFTDIVTSNTVIAPVNGQPQDGACPVTFSSAPKAPIALTTAKPTLITGVLPTSDSDFAFLTYTGTGAVVPQYTPANGLLFNVPLQTTAVGAPVAPVIGVVSSDNQTLYVGTSGDDLVHRLVRGATNFTDSLTPINPLLPSATGSGYAVPNLIAQKPRKATS